MQNSQKACPDMGLSQYELSKEMVYKLYSFNIPSSAKLVLIYLANCYNPNHEEMFPKQKTIAAHLGVSLKSVSRGVEQLAEAGLIIYETKCINRYRFTSKLFSLLGAVNEQSNKEPQEASNGLVRIKSTDALREQAYEKRKAQRYNKSTSGQNVCRGVVKMSHPIYNKKGEQNESFYKRDRQAYSGRYGNYRDIQRDGMHYEAWKPEPLKAQSPMDMTRQEAIEFVGNMPKEIQSKSIFAKQLKEKWDF